VGGGGGRGPAAGGGVGGGAPLLSEVDPLQEGLDPHPNLRGIVVIATG